MADVVDLRLSSVDKKTVDGERSVRLCNYSDVYNHNVIRADMDYMEATATEREIQNCRLKVGDVIIMKDSETPDDIGVPAVLDDEVPNLVCGISSCDSSSTESRSGRTVSSLCPQRENAKRQFQMYANGITRFGLRAADINRVRIPLPSIPEQRKIAAILSSVDDAIEKTQAVIDQAQIVKRGLMQVLFTRGLPGRSTIFKQTEIGSIPIEWTIRSLADTCIARGQYGANVAKRDFEPGGIRYIRITDIDDDGTLKDEAVGINPGDADGYLLRTGDILFARSGATVGKTYLHVADGNDLRCAFAGYLVRFRTRGRILLPAFLKEYLNTAVYWRWVAARQRAQAQPNINASDYGQLPVPLPSLDEQRKIVDVAAGLNRTIRAAIAAVRGHLRLKRALMSVLLTGELRVTPDTTEAA